MISHRLILGLTTEELATHLGVPPADVDTVGDVYLLGALRDFGHVERLERPSPYTHDEARHPFDGEGLEEVDLG